MLRGVLSKALVLHSPQPQFEGVCRDLIFDTPLIRVGSEAVIENAILFLPIRGVLRQELQSAS